MIRSNFSLLGVLHHSAKLWPLLCLCSGNALVYIDLNDFPVRMPGTFNFIPLQLIFQCIDLVPSCSVETRAYTATSYIFTSIFWDFRAKRKALAESFLPEPSLSLTKPLQAVLPPAHASSKEVLIGGQVQQLCRKELDQTIRHRLFVNVQHRNTSIVFVIVFGFSNITYHRKVSRYGRRRIPRNADTGFYGQSYHCPTSGTCVFQFHHSQCLLNADLLHAQTCIFLAEVQIGVAAKLFQRCHYIRITPLARLLYKLTYTLGRRILCTMHFALSTQESSEKCSWAVRAFAHSAVPCWQWRFAQPRFCRPNTGLAGHPEPLCRTADTRYASQTSSSLPSRQRGRLLAKTNLIFLSSVTELRYLRGTSMASPPVICLRRETTSALSFVFGMSSLKVDDCAKQPHQTKVFLHCPEDECCWQTPWGKVSGRSCREHSYRCSKHPPWRWRIFLV